MSTNRVPSVLDQQDLDNTNKNSNDHQEQQLESSTNLKRKCVDYHNPAIIDVQSRLTRNTRMNYLDKRYLQPHSSYICRMNLPYRDRNFFCTQLAHVTRAKNSTPVMCLSWTPGGRRLLTGNLEGEFTLWDGILFNFELIMSAHDTSFRAMSWSHNQNYLLTSDSAGNIKYWSPSIAPVQSLDSHSGQAVHGLTFSPADSKFASCGDDGTVRIWDWASHTEERVLEGHGWDVKTVDWHPRSAVVASGSKDNLVKLWDPKSGSCVSTLYGHKNTVTKLSWNDNGNWLITASRDQLIKMYDIRAMREMYSLQGHNKEVCSIAWHPLHESVFASGGMDGTLLYWDVGPKGSEDPAHRIPFAHDMAIWDLKWHPAGHCLATGSNDRQTKFWSRPRPGCKTNAVDEKEAAEEELLVAEIELGNHVGIVIGRKGATIISMQRSTGAKMHVDQERRVLEIEGTASQIEMVKKRVHALLERVSNQNNHSSYGPSSSSTSYNNTQMYQQPSNKTVTFA